jgi:hypothetical protein
MIVYHEPLYNIFKHIDTNFQAGADLTRSTALRPNNIKKSRAKDARHLTKFMKFTGFES